MKLVPENFKRLFGKRAAKAVNDLAYWVNNFAYGFGLMVNREGGSVNVAIDTESEALKTWLRNVSGASTAAPMQLKATVTSSSLSKVSIYLPSLTVNLGGESYTVLVESGVLTAASDGWYDFSTFRSGDYYLVQKLDTTGTGNTSQLTFSQSAPSDTKLAYVKLGSVSAAGVVTQTAAPMAADYGVPRTACANQNLKAWVSGDGSSEPPSGTGWDYDPQTWQRGVTKYQQPQGTSPETYVEQNIFAGVRIMLVTRIRRFRDNDIHYWRWASFDKDGRLFSLSAEQGCFRTWNEN